MVALNAGEKAAMLAFLKSRRGDKELKSDDIVSKLLDYFAAKGQSVANVEKDVEPGASAAVVEDLAQIWREYAEAAGIDDKPDIMKVGRWISTPEGPGRSLRSGKAGAVADVLSRQGVVLTREQEFAVASALLHVDKGEMESQCKSVGVIWIIWTGQSPGEDERNWFEEKRAAAIMLYNGEQPRVDIRNCKSYSKQLAATTMVTLERALIKDKTGKLWLEYYESTLSKLQNLGYTAAASRFLKVVSFANKVSKGQVALTLEYLYNYFMVEYIGCGMPYEQCNTCALMLGVSPEKQLTVPEENALYHAAVASHGGWHAPSMMQHYYPQQQQQQQQPAVGGMAMRLQHLEAQLQQWNVWAQQAGTAPMQQQQQQQQQQPPDAGGGSSSGDGPPQAEVCEFCGSKQHITGRCTEMHKARASFRLSQKAEKKILEEARKLAKERAEAAGAQP
jgi:ferredoxin